MTSVFIPNSVTSIDAYAFAKCRSLTHIYYGGSEEEWNAIDKSEAWDNATPAGWTPEPVTYTIYFNYTE